MLIIVKATREFRWKDVVVPCNFRSGINLDGPMMGIRSVDKDLIMRYHSYPAVKISLVMFLT